MTVASGKVAHHANQNGAHPTSPGRLTARYLSILRHLRVHALGPGTNSASKVVHFRESGLAQELHLLRAPPAHFAMSNDLAAGIQALHVPLQLYHRTKAS